MPLNEQIQMSISRQTRGVTRAGFGSILILGHAATFTGRIKFYSDVDTALSGELTGGAVAPEYIAASTLCGQSPRIPSFAIGRVGAAEDFATALDAIIQESADFYGVISVDRDVADIEKIADWCETHKRLFFTASSDASIVDKTDTEDTGSAGTVAAYAKSKNLSHTAVFYHTKAATQYLDIAALCRLLSKEAGTFDLAYKDVALCDVDKITPTKEKNARAKNSSVYLTLGGKPCIMEGKTGDGNFIDVIMASDWLEASLTEEIFSVLSTVDKLGCTDEGIQAVTSAMEVPFKTGQKRKVFSETARDKDGRLIGGYEIRAPRASEVPKIDRGNRMLPDIYFSVYLTGGIHGVKISGVITV